MTLQRNVSKQIANVVVMTLQRNLSKQIANVKFHENLNFVL